MSGLAPQPALSGQVVDPDAVDIGELYGQARASLVESVRAQIECGQRLAEKKAALPHGAWLSWLRDNAGVLGFASDGTARKLMRAAGANRSSTTDLSEAEAVAISRKTWGNGSDLRAAVGTDSAPTAERGNNLYETPPEAMHALLAVERFEQVNTIWEPACGRGAICRVLEAAGHQVVFTDLIDYERANADGELQEVGDFLETRWSDAEQGVRGPWRGALWTGERPTIITNPPYGKVLNTFVAHALREHRPPTMALLLNLNFLCGFDDPDRNYVMDDCPPARIHVFTRRLPMMHRDGWAGPEAESRMNTAWFVWERDEDGDYSGARIINRVDWKDHQPAGEVAEVSVPMGMKTAPETSLGDGNGMVAVDDHNVVHRDFLTAQERKAEEVRCAVETIERELSADASEREAAGLIEKLTVTCGARERFASGTHHLRIGGVSTSCTAGRYPLLRRWLEKAQAKRSEEAI